MAVGLANGSAPSTLASFEKQLSPGQSSHPTSGDDQQETLDRYFSDDA
jgi:hypothetical protein